MQNIINNIKSFMKKYSKINGMHYSVNTHALGHPDALHLAS